MDAEAGVRRPGGDGHGHVHVRVLLVAIAGHVLRRDAGLGELVVEEDPGARAALAVNEQDIRTGQVADAFDLFRITRRHHEPLPPVHERDEGDRRLREIAPDVRAIVIAGSGVEEVRTGEVRRPSLQGEQTAEAADVAGGDVDPAAGFLPQEAAEQIDGQVVGADRQKPVVYRLGRAEKLRGRPFPFGEPAHLLRYADDPVCAHDRGDHAARTTDRYRDGLPADIPEDHPDVLLQPQLRRDLASDDRLHAAVLRRRESLHDVKQGTCEFPECDCGRHGVSGDADDGPSRNRCQQCGLAGHDGDAVNQQFAEFFEERGGEVFRAGGSAGDEHDEIVSAHERGFESAFQFAEDIRHGRSDLRIRAALRGQ